MNALWATSRYRRRVGAAVTAISAIELSPEVRARYPWRGGPAATMRRG